MEKLKKWMAGLLCMMLVITMVTGLGVMEVKADTVTVVSTWAELKTAVRSGGDIQLMNDITAGTGDYGFDVYNTVTIDLNGHTIDRGLKEEINGGYVFYVYNGGTLTIKDTSAGQNGTITGGWSKGDEGGGINVSEGTLILESGNIVGNHSNSNLVQRGGGVALHYGGAFTMTGGKISGNEAGYGAGVLVLSNCAFIMTGGEITGNIANVSDWHEGAGVFAYQGADVTIGGNAKIYGNKKANGDNSNLFIECYYGSEKINLSTTVPPTSDAKIGVGYYQEYSGTERTLTDSGKQYKNIFFSDDENYEITTKDGVDGIFYSPKNSSGGNSNTPSDTAYYDLYVDGTQVTSANLSGAGWSYDPGTATLTLDGIQYEGELGGILSYRDLKIVLKGQNILNVKSSMYNGNGITVLGSLVIEGDGSLETTGANENYSSGIIVDNSLTINSGTITATGLSAKNARGIAASSITINGGVVTAKAGEATAGNSCGISANQLILNGGIVTATGEKASGASYGFEVNETVTISPNAVISATGATLALSKKPEGYNTEIGTTFTYPTSTIIEGADGSYTQGSGNTISFRSNDAFVNFQRVLVDNVEISADCYTATEGSIIITLKPEYLNTLAAGAHSISIISANGAATTNFTVQTASTTPSEPATPSQPATTPSEPTSQPAASTTDSAQVTATETAETTTVSPKTGDHDQTGLWIALLILSCGVLTAVGVKKKVK